MKKKAVIVSGYFNPIHKGHIEYFHNAKKYGDKLFVIINNDFQRKLKGSKEFMNQEERKLIVDELKVIDKSFLSIDQDRTVCASLEKIHNKYSSKYDLYFANGGDQTNEYIPEKSVCNNLNIRMIDKLGAKVQSSSWLLKK